MNLKEPKQFENKIMLITYPDSLGRNLSELRKILHSEIGDAVGGIHLLPFFPSSGDRGFAPMTYRQVDPSFGSWDDISALAEDYYLMFDYMINHISAQSEYYKDFLRLHDASPNRDLFIRYPRFWENGGPTQEQGDAIYKRKPRAPYAEAHFADGTEEKVWCTFSDEQIDLNCFSDAGRDFIRGNLRFLSERGAAVIRLDAFAYATKKAGTSCFFQEPEVWNLLNFCRESLKDRHVVLLPEVHEHYSMQQKIAEHGYAVYDFALPMLLLDAIYHGRSQYLKNWFSICPRRQFTTLDTHDGIGVVDVRDLLPDAELERTKEEIFKKGANVKKVYNTSAYHNLDIYQVNCTYYSAVGNDDGAYLLARAVQFFAPGVPLVYYVGMLAGRNDLKLLEETKVGRNINRHSYTVEEVAEETRRPVVRKLLALMRFRNRHPAFGGEFELEDCGKEELRILRKNGSNWARLTADLKRKTFSITYSGRRPDEETELIL